MVVRQVSNLLNISIHQYVIIDMRTFADLINVLGGLDIYVEEDMDYDDIVSLRLEAREKLKKIRPASFGQASRISGVSPADVAALMVYVETYGRGETP